MRSLIVMLLACALATTAANAQSPAPSRTAGAPAWAAFEQTWAGITAYSATVTVFEREGTQVQSSVLDYTFRKPSTATVHFTAGVNAGVTVVWNGGNTVVAHRGSGFVALFKKTFTLHDPEVTTIRGSSIDELSFAAILAHLQATPGTLSQTAGPPILGIPTERVTLVATSPIADTGLTSEAIEFAGPTSLPLRILGYTGATLVRQIDFSNIKLEP
jgi:outer membrane lipoprotein-sorting protein